MEQEQAAKIVRLVERAWDWEMADETFDLWTAAVAGLADQEAAELAVLDLFEHQSRRPGYAEVRTAYDAVRRRVASEQPTLPPASPDTAWSIEGARRLLGVHRIGGDPFHPVLIPDKEIAEAERKARARWMERGLTHQERVASVKADLAKLARSATVIEQ